jgi:uncharacterized integral membrane protein (TIGR00698 family)
LRRPQWLPARQELPGLGLAAGLGVAALLVARALPPSPFVSDILLAMVLGAAALNTPLSRLFGLAAPGASREPDRYASGLRFTGKWVLRAGIILMGLKVQTGFFGTVELALMVGVALAAVPSAFFVAHTLAAALGIRRAMGDLVAGGTMICGASAINAIAPLVGARRDEQGIAIGVTFLFSVLALVAFRPIAVAIQLDPTLAGIWSGLAVNDLSSAVAVGSQMGGAGGVMAAAAKSVRVLLLAPVLVIFAVMRRDVQPIRGSGSARASMRQSIVDQLPAFVLGYLALAIVRAIGDRLFGAAPAWAALLRIDKTIVDLCMVTVGASIGLHLALRSLLATSAPAIAVGAGASAWMASLTLAMIVAASRGAHAMAVIIAVAGVLASHALYRVVAGERSVALRVRRLFERGAALSMSDAGRLLEASEREGPLETEFLRRVLEQLHPSIGELIPVRHSPLPHGAGCRWMTYWEGKSGWALVALSREPGSMTPIHAHPHRLIGKSIEGALEEVRFSEHDAGELEVTARKLLAHGELVEADGLQTVHLVRVSGSKPAIDLQLRGPEDGTPGRCFRVAGPFDAAALAVGQRLRTIVENDDRPGHGGEGAAAGRVVASG